MEKTKITAFVSQKGGVGKSSNAVMTANYLAALDYSVLVIDTDYGNSLTQSYLTNRSGMSGKGFARAVRRRNIGDNIIQTKRDNVELVPSNDDIERLEIKDPDALVKLFAAEAETLSVYDYTIIDTAAGYTSVTAAVIEAADLILTPFRLSRFDLAGCSSLFNKIGLADKRDAWRIFFNDVRYSALKENSRQSHYIAECRRYFDQSLDIFIPQTVTVPVAADMALLIKWKRNERLFEAVRRLAGLVIGEEAPEVEAF